MKLKSVQGYHCSYISICFGFVGAHFQGKDEDIEDEDDELSETGEEEQEPEEPKKDKGSKNVRGLLKLGLNRLHR